MEGQKTPLMKPVISKKLEEKKILRYPRYHNDSLRQIIYDLKIENSSLRKKIEMFENMYRKLEKEFNDYKMGIFDVREMDVLGNDYFQNNPDEQSIQN